MGQVVRESLWLFPIIESVHLLALALIGGSVLVVDLRLLGFGLSAQPVARVARDAWPWFVASLITMIVTGVLLFASEALRCYYSPPFWWKMQFLAAAILFSFTIRRKASLSEDQRLGPIAGKLVALISLALWSGVGISGRWIAFY